MGPGGGTARLEELHKVLKAKREDSEQLLQDITGIHAEKEAAKAACMAGVEAAKVQMARLTAELKLLQAPPRNSIEEETGGASQQGSTAQSAAECAHIEALRLQGRHLRHELSKWRHQAQALEAESKGQEDEIAYLKAQLAHARDVLDSTRSAVRHHEVERQLRDAALLPLTEEPGSAHPHKELRLWQGGDPMKLQTALGKLSLETKCERNIRERVEERADALNTKAQKLMSIVSSQQLVIQNLEQQLIKEEDALQQRDWQLMGLAKQQARLKGALRQRSDGVVALAVGVPGIRKRSSSLPPGRCPDAVGATGGSLAKPSTTQLPVIQGAVPGPPASSCA